MLESQMHLLLGQSRHLVVVQHSAKYILLDDSLNYYKNNNCSIHALFIQYIIMHAEYTRVCFYGRARSLPNGDPVCMNTIHTKYTVVATSSSQAWASFKDFNLRWAYWIPNLYSMILYSNIMMVVSMFHFLN